MQNIGHDRREFIAKSFCLAGAAGLAAFGLRATAAQAQTAPRSIRRSERYDDSFITERKALQVAGQQHACGLIRAQCGGLAIRLRIWRRGLPESN